jgi:hypothetical protein
MSLTLTLVGALAAACGGDDEHVIDASAAFDSALAADAAIDATGDDACAACGEGTICVQRFDGTCGELFLGCVETAVVCPDNACSTECEDALCGGAPLQCQTRTPCGDEVPGAFTCYGP